MTRAEHVRWCKERAHREYDFYKASNPVDARRNAVASILSDLGKHEETRDMTQIAFAVSMTVKDEPSLFRFIDGFAE